MVLDFAEYFHRNLSVLAHTLGWSMVSVEAQIERYAPGFRELVLARQTHNTIEMQINNPNYVGGDIVGGVQDLRRLYFRPFISLNPHTTPLENVYLCSSATPLGGGVHAMCGYHAAHTVLRRRGLIILIAVM